MSAARALPDIRVASARPVPIRTQTKRPELSVIQGAKGTRVEAVRSPLTAKTPFGFLLLCALVLLTSLVIVQVLQANIARTPFEVDDLRTQIRQVEQDIQIKEAQLHRAENNLPNAAAELGMLPANGARESLYLTSYVAQVTGGVIGGVSARDAH